VYAADQSWRFSKQWLFGHGVRIRSLTSGTPIGQFFPKRDGGELRLHPCGALKVRFDSEVGTCQILDRNRIELIRVSSAHETPVSIVSVSTLAWSRKDLALLLSTGLYLLLGKRRETWFKREFWQHFVRKTVAN
jgi:hypothetical protein